MKVILTVTKDQVTGQCVNTPIINHNEADAKRSFKKAVQELEEQKAKDVPLTDLQLFCIAAFDTESLEIVPDTHYICSAAEFLKGE